MIAHIGSGADLLLGGLLVCAGALAIRTVHSLREPGTPRWRSALLVTGAAGSLAGAVLVPLMSSQAPARIRPHSQARLAIVEPADGETVRGKTIEVALTLTGGRLVPWTSSRNLRGDEGHVHLSIDGTLLSMVVRLTQSIDINGLGSGGHTLTAEYVAADHAPFNPRVQVTVRFVVR